MAPFCLFHIIQPKGTGGQQLYAGHPACGIVSFVPALYTMHICATIQAGYWPVESFSQPLLKEHCR